MPISGIAWHRDQDGNIFLSGSFETNDPLSDENRWMITNLAALTYDPVRDDNTTAISAPGVSITPSTTIPRIVYPRSYGNSIPTPPPANDQTIYKYNPRVGLLYNWAAATMGRNSSSNEKNSTLNVQGICPNGWHLPSYQEFAQLFGDVKASTLGEISNNYSVYSKVPDNSGLNMAGKAVKEGCQQYNEAGQGQSNPITADERAGFNWILIGYAGNQSFGTYGSNGSLWMSNSASSSNAYYGFVWKTTDAVNLENYGKDIYLSVRCKKNTL